MHELNRAHYFKRVHMPLDEQKTTGAVPIATLPSPMDDCVTRLHQRCDALEQHAKACAAKDAKITELTHELNAARAPVGVWTLKDGHVHYEEVPANDPKAVARAAKLTRDAMEELATVHHLLTAPDTWEARLKRLEAVALRTDQEALEYRLLEEIKACMAKVWAEPEAAEKRTRDTVVTLRVLMDKLEAKLARTKPFKAQARALEMQVVKLETQLKWTGQEAADWKKTSEVRRDKLLDLEAQIKTLHKAATDEYTHIIELLMEQVSAFNMQ
jgi:hypothetical protein